MNPQDYPLIISTTQFSPIKTLLEALKELLGDTGISFNEKGINILNMDMARTIVINVKLNASEFEFYHCKYPITISLNVGILHFILKSVNNGDTLTLFLEPSENDKFSHLVIKRENIEKNVISFNKMSLYDVDAENMEIEPISYNCTVLMPSSSFQKIVRDMKTLSKTVEIQNVDNKIIFKGQGDFCAQETIMTDSRENQDQEVSHNEVAIYNKNSPHKVIQGVFHLRYLSSFTKCTQLSNVVEINLGNKLPITVQYNVANLGYIRLCLLPIIEDDE